MKTIVQKLGLCGKRFLLATSLASAGVITANAITSGDTYVIKSVARDKYLYDDGTEHLKYKTYASEAAAKADATANWVVTVPTAGSFQMKNVSTNKYISCGNWTYIGNSNGYDYNYFDMQASPSTAKSYAIYNSQGTDGSGNEIYTLYMNDAGTRYMSAGYSADVIAHTNGISGDNGKFTFIPVAASDPSAPSNVTATRASATSVTITWDAVDDASGYTLYKSTNGSSWDEGTAAATNSATDSGLTSDIRYYYKVTATVGGDESSASSVVSAVPGTLPDNLAFVAGPFMIRNNWTGFGYQYLYYNTTGNDYTGEEVNNTSGNPSPSDATPYANYGHVLRNIQGSNADATYLVNANYMWDIYSYTIGNNTHYAIRNVVTGRYMHTGAYTDYYSQDGANNSINVFAWNSTNVSGATAINGDSNANKELSYYLYNFKVGAVQDVAPSNQADVAVNAAGFTAQIMTQRFAWGQRVLHGEYSGNHTNDSRGSIVFATDNHANWGTKSWLFTAATRPAPTGLT
ncbi:MAG: fibronectin type III domain-containing protein, partial [Paludibacteraceae bacterium]|nr:fibronectin type III domain-containing protein [Paludibacteraceae bacterium]